MSRIRFRTLSFGVLVATSLLIAACRGQKQSETDVRCEYVPDTDKTVLEESPYPEINLPGLWEYQNKANSGREYFLMQDDSIFISLAINPKDFYPFAKEAPTNDAFLKQLYSREATHFKSLGLKEKVLEQNTAHHYIIWKLYGKLYGAYISKIYLMGIKHHNAYNFTVSRGMPVDQDRITFLKEVFEDN
jgi:hypothetical protein